MSTHQLSFFEPPRRHDGVTLKAYRPNGQEVPAHLPRLEEGAETMQARVLEWFRDQFVTRTVEIPGAPDEPFRCRIQTPLTPSDCAEGMGRDLTTVRPRICQLAKRTSGPRLEHCKWIKRRPTGRSSEGWYRYKEGV